MREESSEPIKLDEPIIAKKSALLLVGASTKFGAGAIRSAGGRVLPKPSQRVVYGMPRTVVEAGFSNANAPISGMAALITKNL